MPRKTTNIIPFQSHEIDSDVNDNDFGGLISRYGDGLRGYLRKSLPTDGDIEDIVQEVFCRVLEYEKLGPVRNPSAFLYRTARNILVDRYRKRNTQTDAQEKISYELGASSQEDTFLEYNEMVMAFKEALNDLPAKCRQVFLMRRRDGLSNSEIAEVLGISSRMVQKHMIKALEHFQGRLR